MSSFFIDVIAGPAAGGYIKIGPEETRVIGRSRAADLTIDDDLISAQHLIVAAEAGTLRVQDLHTTNGTVLHDHAGSAHKVGGSTLWQETALVQIGAHLLQLRPARIHAAEVTGSGTGFSVVQLSPPHTRATPPPQLDDPPEPPKRPGTRRIPWVSMGTSALGGLVMAAVLRTAFLLVFSVLAPAGMLLQFLWEKRRARRDYDAELAQHDQELAAHEREKIARASAEARALRLQACDPAQSRRHTQIPTVGLWQFTGHSLDGHTRQSLTSHKLLLGFIKDGATHLPVHAPLSGSAVGIFGDPRAVASLTQWLAVQIATGFAPSQVAIRGPWPWLKHLPHSAPLASGSALFPPGSATRETCWFSSAASAQTEAAASDETECHIVFARSRAQLPAHCQTIIEARSNFTARFEDLATNQVLEVTHLCGITSTMATEISMEMRELRDHDSLPRPSWPLAEIWGEPDSAAVMAHWETAQDDPGRLRCPIGTDAAAQTVHPDLQAHGPHALIGGTTGAGKSVLQRALVTSLALSQRPEHLAIVLVDYKGGAAFRCLENLPHVIDIVTDLEESATVRTLQSLRAELRRRERLLADHGFSDHAQLAAAGHIALAPRLVLVVDELRALGEQHPELLNELVQLAALGRSLGVHLILATQRPGSSVNADMRANINMRIALRVQSASDSQDILDLPDAAQLPAERPGAALMRLGSGAARELQVAAITDDDASALAAIIAQAARKLGAKAPRRPWLPPLPRVLRELPTDAVATDAGQIPAGLRDHPNALHQDLLNLRLGTGHLVIAGGPGSGRTSALRTLARHSSVPVHVIARDADSIVDVRAPWIGTRTHLEDQRLIIRLCESLLGQGGGEQILLIDDADWLLDPENGLTRSWQAVQEVLRRGREQQITVVLAGGRMLLGPRVSELTSIRWILNWTDDTALNAGVLPRGTVIPPGPGGTAEVTSDGVTAARILLVPQPTTGSWGNATAEECSDTLPNAPDHCAQGSKILRLQPLPTAVAASELTGLTPVKAVPPAEQN
ncbi:MAG TPA: FtsK/SpoIIIE domain-containing protein, partial [Actinomycetales bacterium]|nr:FtsK/SpoIIIE domain-containing protein [Actinomycetales bacterium]